jgi:hypothetical protein
MENTEYEKAWQEGEKDGKEAAPATEAVKAAKKAADEGEQGEYIKAYTEMDEAEKKSDDKEAKK